MAKVLLTRKRKGRAEGERQQRPARGDLTLPAGENLSPYSFYGVESLPGSLAQ